MKYTFSLPQNVLKLMDIFKKNGHRADIVGGCVRDFLLGTEPHDFDMTTSATPDEMKDILKDFKTVETGIKHGTLTVLMDSIPYEITTYRIDGDYKDNRHPDSVTFSRNIEQDLSRRDFTVNAIAYNPYDGITDIFDGISDIKYKILRSVGEADRRFSEDALRILRAVRFSSALGFEIDPDTARSALENRELLKNVSRERIYSEWQKLIMGKNSLSVISQYLPIINTFLPKLCGIGTLTPHTFEGLDLIERQCALFYSSSCSDSYPAAMKALRSDSKSQLLGTQILRSLSHLSSKSAPLTSDREYQRLLFEYGEMSVSALKILEALGTPCGSSQYASSLIISGAPYRICDLAVNGDDLKALGIGGEEIGRLLKSILYKIIDTELPNNSKCIVEYVKNYCI